MKSELMNLFLFIGICFVLYLLFKNFNFSGIKEGMTDASGNSVTPPQNGVAGNAASYGATIKAESIKLQDAFLISKYRSDYETAILNLDDLINNLMLNTALSIDVKNPAAGIKKLAEMNQAKSGLNSVMKFVDKN
jgi:hypothetical protein